MCCPADTRVRSGPRVSESTATEASARTAGGRPRRPAEFNRHRLICARECARVPARSRTSGAHERVDEVNARLWMPASTGRRRLREEQRYPGIGECVLAPWTCNGISASRGSHACVGRLDVGRHVGVATGSDDVVPHPKRTPASQRAVVFSPALVLEQRLGLDDVEDVDGLERHDRTPRHSIEALLQPALDWNDVMACSLLRGPLRWSACWLLGRARRSARAERRGRALTPSGRSAVGDRVGDRRVRADGAALAHALVPTGVGGRLGLDVARPRSSGTSEVVGGR